MSKFYKVDIQGKNWIQRVSSLPVWTANDEGRILYAEDTDEMYVGDDTGWQRIANQDDITTVEGQIPTVLGDLSDVDTTGSLDGEALVYNAGSSEWQPGTVAGVDVPDNTILLIESDTAIVGYTLLTGIDDYLAYITKGSAAGGETGGTTKTGSTWTQPTHTHTGGNHALTVSEMPSHRHSYSFQCGDNNDDFTVPPAGSDGSLEPGIWSDYTDYTGSNSSHNHGQTSNQNFSGGDSRSSWRPRGRNFTRQRRNI